MRSLSLDIHEGDVFGLIGKSGAGKSTLLRLINLLERPDAGKVLVGGRDLTTLSRRELRDTRQNIGMIFQQFNLIQNATVFDNVAFPLKIHGRHSRAEIEARVRECLALVGLGEKIDSYPAQLSGGQKQRVAIARALAPRPQVLLCDEPTSALDSETTRALLETLRDINLKLGVTIVIVTHELSVVEVLCRQVAILEQGRLVEQFEVDSPAANAPPRSAARSMRWCAAASATRARRSRPRRLHPSNASQQARRRWPMPENIVAILPELGSPSPRPS